MNPLRYLKEKIISKLSLENPGDVKRLTVLANDREALLLAIGYSIARDNDPLELSRLLDEWLTLRIAVKARSRRDIKEVYMYRPIYYTERTGEIEKTSPFTPPEEQKKRRWL